MTISNHLRRQARELRLSGLLSTLEIRLQEAARSQLSHLEFLEMLLQDEHSIRGQRLRNRRTRAASFRDTRSLDHYDFRFQPELDRRLIYELATNKYLQDRRDILMIGPPGVGKSHLAQALGAAAIAGGHTVLYRSIFDLVRDLASADYGSRSEAKLLESHLRPDLLIIDDMGLKTLPSRSAEILLEIILRRHEVRSTLVTSNRPVQDWGQLLGDVPSATAILDRLMHRSTVIQLTGRSYRLESAAQAASAESPTKK
jgi:DNA replication protein DnaC